MGGILTKDSCGFICEKNPRRAPRRESYSENTGIT